MHVPGLTWKKKQVLQSGPQIMKYTFLVYAIFPSKEKFEASTYQFSLQVWYCNSIGYGPEVLCLFFRLCFSLNEWVSENRSLILKGSKGVNSSFLQRNGNLEKVKARDHHRKACKDNVGNNFEGQLMPFEYVPIKACL